MADALASDDEGIAGVLAVVADCGSHSCRAGMSGDENPRVNFASVVGNAKGAKDGSGRVVGAEAVSRRAELALRRAYRGKVAADWDDVEHIWSQIFSELSVPSNEHPVLVAEPHLCPKFHREQLAQLMFETFTVPALLTQSQAVLALFATGGTHGVVVDSSESATHVVPVWDGKPLTTSLVPVSGGGGALTRLWREQLLARNSGGDGEEGSPIAAMASDVFALEELKHAHCFVPADAQAFDAVCDADGSASRGTASVHKLPDGTKVTIGRADCARVGEALFRPDVVGEGPGAVGLQRQCGIAVATQRAILNCEVAIRPSLYSNVVLCGGNCQMDGFAARFESELGAIAPAVHAVGLHSTKVELQCTPEDAAGAAVWRGGSLLAALSTFEKLAVAKADYDESGPSIINRKTF